MGLTAFVSSECHHDDCHVHQGFWIEIEGPSIMTSFHLAYFFVSNMKLHLIHLISFKRRENGSATQKKQWSAAPPEEEREKSFQV